MEEEDAEKHAHQGIDIVSEAGVHDVVMGDGPDENAPVGGDEKGGGYHEKSLRSMMEEIPDGGGQKGPHAQDPKEDGHEDERPDNAVRQDFIGAGAFQKLPVQRKHAPDDVAGKGCHKSLFIFRQMNHLPFEIVMIPLYP